MYINKIIYAHICTSLNGSLFNGKIAKRRDLWNDTPSLSEDWLY